MNANVNLGLNNLIAGKLQQTKLQKNNTAKAAGSSSAFMQMLQLLMEENGGSPYPSGVTQDGVISGLTGSVLTNPALTGETGAGGAVNLPGYGQSEKTQDEEIYDSMLAMMGGINYTYPYLYAGGALSGGTANNIGSEDYIRNILPLIEAYGQEGVNAAQYGDAQNPLGQMPYLTEPGLAEPAADAAKGVFYGNVQNPLQGMEQQADFNKENPDSKASLQAENPNETGGSEKIIPEARKLIQEIEGDRSRLIDDLDRKKELAEYSINLYKGPDKVIEVSDQSSQIKPTVLSQVEDKIILMAGQEKNGTGDVKYVTMELHPESMGKVDIKMTMEDKRILVEIKASNEETQKLLSSNIAELVRVLNKDGDTNINVIIKSYVPIFPENLPDYNENGGHGRQYANQEHQGGDTKKDDEDSTFSQIVNARLNNT